MEFQALVGRLQATLMVSRIRNMDDFLEEVRSIQAGFKGLNRSKCAVTQLVSLKYQMQHWRAKVVKLLLQFIEGKPTPEEGMAVIQALSMLELKPGFEDLQGLAHWARQMPSNELKGAAAEYFAQVNERDLLFQLVPHPPEGLLRIAGPGRKLPIVANVSSRWTVDKWGKLPEFAYYAMDPASGEKGVRYRGLQFLPGDLLICNVNRDGNGVYTAVVEPRSYGYHLGVFAILDHEGRKLPVVLEAFQTGVRVVPLSTFLSPGFNSYVEVVRVRKPPADFHSKINELAGTFPAQVKGYNFDTEDPDRSYLACTTIGTLLLEQAGAAPVRARTRYIQEMQVQKNLAVFDLVLPAFLSPSDYLTDENLEFVGVVDNDQFHRNVARELVERHFVEIFRKGTLALERLPFMFRLNYWAVRQARAGTLIGKIILATHGFNATNFPKGPEKVLAIIELYEQMVAAAVKKADKPLRRLWDSRRLIDIDQLARDAAIARLMEQKLHAVWSGFHQNSEA